jgi:sulfatase maturation enzyme AslB (radical SAM superfamily)
MNDDVFLEFKEQEPFVGLETLIRISNYFIADSLTKNYRVMISLVTNGTLLGNIDVREYLYTYKRYFSSCILSLDGYKDVQDLQRPGSWNKIVENWDFLRKYTNDSIIINSVCSNNVLDIYSSNLIKVLNTFKGISIVMVDIDISNDFSIQNANKFIEQMEIIIKYLKSNKKNIKLRGFQYQRHMMTKKQWIGAKYLLSDKIRKIEQYEQCSQCYNLDCIIGESDPIVPTKERIEVQCYLYNKINEIHNKYYE